MSFRRHKKRSQQPCKLLTPLIFLELAMGIEPATG